MARQGWIFVRINRAVDDQTHCRDRRGDGYPQGYEIQVRPRSGLALKQGLTVANAPGTIDSDYRGEVKVILINLGEDPVKISHGMRIAQLVLAPVSIAAPEIVSRLDETDRGAGGFGSTGTTSKG